MSNPYQQAAPPPVLQPNSSPTSVVPWIIGCMAIAMLGALALGGIVYYFVLWVFALTQPVVDASDAFAQRIAQGKISEAYLSTSRSWKARQGAAAFAETMEKSGLKGASITWSNRSIRNQSGRVDGTANFQDGRTMPIVVRLAYEDEQWKIDDVSLDVYELADGY